MADDPTTNEANEGGDVEAAEAPVAATAADAAPSDAASAQSNTRTFILLGVLALAVVALLYDYFVARPAVEAAHNKINATADERSAAPGGQLTNTEIAELLGKQPAKVEKGQHYYVERYAWMGGLPWRSYDCWVVYTPSSDGDQVTYRFNSVYLNEKPEPQFMPGYKAPNSDPDPNLPPDPAGSGPGGGGGGPPGGGGGPPGGGPPGGGRPDREGGRPPLDDDSDAKEGDAKEGDAKEGDAKEGDAKEGDAKEGDAKEGDAKEGDAKEGDAKEGDAKEGDAKEGDAKEGDAKEGDAKEGDAKDGDAKEGDSK